MITAITIAGFTIAFFLAWKVGVSVGYRDGYIDGAIDAAVQISRAEEDKAAEYLERFGAQIDAGRRGDN